MKTLLAITATLLLTITMVFGQSSNLSTSEIETLREERSVALFNMQNKHDIQKQKAMGETFKMNVEKADLENKRNEIEIVNDATFPKYAEMNNSQKAAWEYEKAKKEWVAANPDKYASMMANASTN